MVALVVFLLRLRLRVAELVRRDDLCERAAFLRTAPSRSAELRRRAETRRPPPAACRLPP